MRVVGGSARGRQLRNAPSAATRATSDKVRGAIFDILAAYLDHTSRVLDLYAGTGALGIEALSRGALACTFVENNAACCVVIRANLALCGFSGSGRVLCTAVSAALALLEDEGSSTGDPLYDLIVMDPPYEDPAIDNVLEHLAHAPLLRPGGLLVLEHTRRREMGHHHGPLAYWRTKVYGDTAVSVWQRREDDHTT